MLDIKYIVNNAEEVKENCKNRHAKCDIDTLIDFYQKKNQLQNDVDGIRKRRKELWTNWSRFRGPANKLFC